MLILTGTLLAVWVLVADQEFPEKLAGPAIVAVPLIAAGVFFTLAGTATTGATAHR